MSKTELKWASFVSGGGTTMQEMDLSIKRGEVQGVKLELVVSSSPRAGAIRRAQELGLEPGQIVIINPKDFTGEDGEIDQDGFGKAILTTLKEHDIDFFTQNGWLKRTPDRVIEEFEGFNQHPQRSDIFGGSGMHGLRPHAARLYYAQMAAEFNPKAEPVVQRVGSEYDSGEVVIFDRVSISPEITGEEIVNFGAGALQKHVLPFEHQLNIELLKQMSAGTVHGVSLPEMPHPRYGTVDQLAEAARIRAIQNLP